jgi:hypothetical protein
MIVIIYCALRILYILQVLTQRILKIATHELSTNVSPLYRRGNIGTERFFHFPNTSEPGVPVSVAPCAFEAFSG